MDFSQVGGGRYGSTGLQFPVQLLPLFELLPLELQNRPSDILFLNLFLFPHPSVRRNKLWSKLTWMYVQFFHGCIFHDLSWLICLWLCLTILIFSTKNHDLWKHTKKTPRVIKVMVHSFALNICRSRHFFYNKCVLKPTNTEVITLSGRDRQILLNWYIAL